MPNSSACFGVTTEWQRTYNGALRDDGINHVRGGPQVLRPFQGRPRHRARAVREEETHRPSVNIQPFMHPPTHTNSQKSKSLVLWFDKMTLVMLGFETQCFKLREREVDFLIQ